MSDVACTPLPSAEHMNTCAEQWHADAFDIAKQAYIGIEPNTRPSQAYIAKFAPVQEK